GQYEEAVRAIPSVTNTVTRTIRGSDSVWIAPVRTVRLPRVDDAVEALDDFRLSTLKLTAVANLMGAPAISIPAGQDAEGLPLGVQLIGQRGDDMGLLLLAQWCEARLSL